MNDLNIACFLSAARTGSFSVTARELYITQQAVSRNLQKLEEELGAALFTRGSTLRLTRAGEEYHRVFAQWNGEMTQASLRFRASSGRLRLAWPEAAGLPDCVRALPEMPELLCGTAAELQQFLRFGLADVVLLPERCAVPPGAVSAGAAARLPLYRLSAEETEPERGVCWLEEGLGLPLLPAMRHAYLPNSASVLAQVRLGGWTLSPRAQIAGLHSAPTGEILTLNALRKADANAAAEALCRRLTEGGGAP